mgnify:CR=1 FL=1
MMIRNSLDVAVYQMHSRKEPMKKCIEKSFSCLPDADRWCDQRVRCTSKWRQLPSFYIESFLASNGGACSSAHLEGPIQLAAAAAGTKDSHRRTVCELLFKAAHAVFCIRFNRIH